MNGGFPVSSSTDRRAAMRPGAVSQSPKKPPMSPELVRPPATPHSQAQLYAQPQQSQPQPSEPQEYYQPVPAAPPPRVERPSKRRRGRRRVGLWVAIIAGSVILLNLAAWYVLLRLQPSDPAINRNEYQAVFFTSGQACLGKLQPVDSAYMRLTNVFCLQKQADNAASTAKSIESSNIQLTNLANDALGPHDEMIIARSQILFYENLKSDGKAAKAIQSYGTQK